MIRRKNLLFNTRLEDKNSTRNTVNIMNIRRIFYITLFFGMFIHLSNVSWRFSSSEITALFGKNPAKDYVIRKLGLYQNINLNFVTVLPPSSLDIIPASCLE